MAHRSVLLVSALSLLALMGIGCSLIGRVVGRAVDDATGGAVSTMESLQTEMGEALATLPAQMPEIPEALPDEFPFATQLPSALGTEGTISGSLSYPSEGIPPLKVVAFSMETQALAAAIETEAGQSAYTLTVPYGAYYVVAYTLDGELAAGYSLAVMCGLNADCTDHTLIPIIVAPGFNPEGIDPADWYAPEGSFPPMP